ncbi:MAG: S8 family serine peptidase [Moorea sp. SIOASIH]|uniref:S8 family serine peptidase n=1 Tax=Moorena sp. SIOASIH TaxID=2607817 RepID=UPI0013BC2246|nr:S8 family serine peptidase [Moorena sp. SIOASIH]NEO39380.1 S8 family serine peptidase [Moorena sp. SIOASIH]
MTRSSSHTPDESSTSQGVPETSVGIVLQRGGDELSLEKVSDRFTIYPKNSTVTDELAQSIRLEHHGQIQSTLLQEFTVPGSERDPAMQAARENEAVAFASHVYQIKDNPDSLIYLTDELTIQFIPEADQNAIASVTDSFGLQIVQPVEGIPNTFVCEVTASARENPIKIANRLTGLPEVLTAEPNIVIPQEPFYRPQDTLYPKQWYLNHNGGAMLSIASHIHVEQAWDITRGDRSVVVAVTDDAIDINHPDFSGPGKIVAPRDFKDQDFLPIPTNSGESHGTACAGIAVAEENGQGIVGVAPKCALMPMRTSGFLDDRSIEALFDWAVDHGASVISCSWGAASAYFPLSLRQRAAITRAATKGRQGKGCVIVFAAGNANRPVSGTIYERGWPNNLLKGSTEWLSGFAVHPDVITVSACNSLGKKSAYSNWGENVSVCAPSNNAPPGMWFPNKGYVYTAPIVTGGIKGLGVFSADQVGSAGYETGDFVGNFGGTSSACPVVAGVAALVLSVNPDLTAGEVKQILEQSADKIVDPNPDPQLNRRLGTYDTNGHSQWFGYGKVNAFKAVKAAQEKSQERSSASKKVIEGINDRSVNIPDNNPRGITSRIRLTQSASVREIQVKVDIEHEFLGDIEISLKSPTGEIVLLQSRTLGARRVLKQTYSVETTPALKLVLNKPASGVWQLQVVDDVAMDTGRLNSWELILGVA